MISKYVIILQVIQIINLRISPSKLFFFLNQLFSLDNLIICRDLNLTVKREENIIIHFQRFNLHKR